MKIISLNTEQAPPISVPMRFFTVAPLFLLMAALMLVTGAGNPFDDMRSPALLAATHCITLGFMAMIMMGAMQQILPVVIGSPMPASRLTVWLTFLPLLSGALLLPAGFMLGKPALLNLAWPLLGLAFIAFISASLASLARSPAHNATKTAILLSILALSGAIVLGMLLAQGHASGSLLPYDKLATAHISLALGGWVMLLIVGVSYQVVPMFQLTPNYPKWLVKGLTPAIFIVLLLSMLSRLFEPGSHWLTITTQGLFWFLASSFALITLRLQSNRRRRVADATLSFFRLGMMALLCAGLFALATLVFPAIDSLGTVSALLFLLGFAMSLMHGMLYKIVPFLVWFHLFRGGVNSGVPNMKEIIPETWKWRHFWLHCSTLLAALLAPWWNAATWLVALGLLLQGMLLEYTLLIAISVYRRTLERIGGVSP
ncbi:MAG: hypothetical protein AWT59_1110 [Candidatus Gallionella acididurans]|uniref:Transmembrane protein n=1 Tax=Candidatus Gallionella acididurans TaxID=1796491 RepID=A0A139BV84_9PROT|nr:MAG: hypothetical protein AWT59_1110 [Candidatus Gallionella acididurans]